jgi:probable HAF family extracellular repeat protein
MKQFVIISAVSISLFVAKTQAQQYQVIDLGTLGGPSSGAYAINNLGQVAGFVNTSGGQTHASLYVNGQMQDLNTLTGNVGTAYAFGVNDNRQVVGYSDAQGGTHGFIYSNGSMRDAGTLGGPNSEFLGINANGVAVGDSQTGMNSNPYHAVVYSGGIMHDIGNLGYNYNYDSYATAINNNGQIVGYAGTPFGGSYHAFLYSSGSMHDLGTLTGNRGQSFANAINDNGIAVGYASTGPNGSGNSHAVMFMNNAVQDLGTISSGDSSVALGINDDGQVVGFSGQDAFLYENGHMENLNNLIAANSGWRLEYANAINDSGDIVGRMFNSSGQQEAFLLVPQSVPDTSSTSLLMAIGTMTLIAFQRRSLSR